MKVNVYPTRRGALKAAHVATDGPVLKARGQRPPYRVPATGEVFTSKTAQKVAPVAGELVDHTAGA